MSDRKRLPNRRATETFEFTCNNLDYVASVGFSNDGQPLEIFVNAGKAGTHLAIATQEAAILTSVALQRGASLDELRSGALRAEGGVPESPVGHLLDLIAARLNTKPPEAVT